MSAPDRKRYTLTEANRQWVGSLVATLEPGWTVTLAPKTRSSEQNRLLHSALSDIAEQVEWKGQRFPMLVWKRLCTAAWLREKGEWPTLVPSLDGSGLDVIYERTSQLSVAQCSELLEWCYAFGAQNGVTFKF